MSDDPMTIIQRHHPAAMCEHFFLHALSDMSAVIGGFDYSDGEGPTLILTWTDREADIIVVQLSRCGVFVADELPRNRVYQIAGMCYLHGLPLFTENDLVDLFDQDREQSPTNEMNVSIN